MGSIEIYLNSNQSLSTPSFKGISYSAVLEHEAHVQDVVGLNPSFFFVYIS